MVSFRPQKGLTLIEIMLAIAVMAMIGLMVTSFLRERTRSATVDVAATQMQQILASAQQFYLQNNGRWPQTLQQMVDRGFLGKALANPQQALCSPWSLQNSDVSACKKLGRGNYFIVRVVKGQMFNNYFGIYVYVSGQHGDGEPSQSAKDLASRLPVATAVPVSTDKNISIVYTYVSHPSSQMFEATRGFPVYAGIVNDGDSVPMPTCPEGYDGHYMPFPALLITDLVQQEGMLMMSSKAPTFNAGITYEFEGNTKYINNSNPFKLTYFITMCLPKDKWTPKYTKNAISTQMGAGWINYAGNNQS